MLENAITLLDTYADKVFVTYEGIWWKTDDSKPLTNMDDGGAQLQQHTVMAIPFDSLGASSETALTPRSVVALRFTIGDCVDITTCPIWMKTPKNKTGENDSEFLFDLVDEYNFVNIWFMIYAVKSLSFVDNYAKMSFFKIGETCRHLGVLKLKNLTPAIKATTPIHPSFKNSMSWMMGVWNKHGKTIENQYVIKTVIASLYSRGLVKRSNVSIESLKKTD
jgi:hypothetical protein